MVEAGNQRVIERGASLGHERGHGALELAAIAGEQEPMIAQRIARVVIETDDEELVLRMTRAREAHRRGDDFAQLRPHAATRVDDEPDRHRRVFVAEQFDRHATPVVVHDEPVAIETRDELSALVGDDNRQHDELTRSAAECWGLMRIRREEREGQEGRQKGKNEGQESKRSWEKASY